MTKEIKKVEDKEMEIERVRELFTKSGGYSKHHIGEYIELSGKSELTSKEKERKDELQLEISKANALKNGLWTANLSYEKYHKFLATTRSTLVKEHDCKTPVEFMLADRIVANYWRSMRLDMVLNRLIETEDGGYSFNDSKINTIRELSKGLESASRQLNMSVLLLKELKQPSLEVTIKTKNAFLAQNQQFNAGNPAETTKNEINDSK